jgi:CopG family nickel-responsive transcriptional regulator
VTETEVSRISISLPRELLREFDESSRQIGHEDRSKAIRAAMRSLITESIWTREEQGAVVGALIIVYDHHVKGLEEKMTGIQHHYKNVVASSMHIHLDERNCLEIIAVRGESREIKNLAQKLTIRGVKQLKQATITPQ